MGTIGWNAAMSVGVKEIDEQHKIWFRRLDDMVAAIQRMEGPDRIAETLDFLVTYTAEHFAAEEALMAARAYPEAAEHLRQHAELRTTLAKMIEDFEEDGANHLLAADIGTFLGNWLVRHIGTTDRKLGAFLGQA